MCAWTRRKLLAASGLSVGGALLGGTLAARPRARVFRDERPGRKTRFDPGHRVVVVGGGLAGLSAALELAERGAEVTLVEAAPHLGGKLGGWPIDLGGERYAMEHGFHGFFAQYYNLADVITRLGLDGEFASAETYPLLYRTGHPEAFPGRSRGFPADLVSFALGSKNLRLGAFAGATDELHALLSHDPEATYARWDAVDFESFCAAGIDRDVTEFFFRPFAKTTLNHPRTVSAAYVLSFFHFYFIGNPEGMSFRATRRDAMTSLIHPFQSQLERLGVRLVLGTPVESLALKGGRVAEVVLGARSGAEVVLRGLEPERVPEGAPVQVGSDARGAPLFVSRRGEELFAVVGRCTHRGCHVEASADGFSCPCHGARFDRAGQVTRGPAERSLERLRVVGRTLATTTAEERRLPADAVVLATDVRGARRVAEASAFPEPARAQLLSLGEAEPYLVLRLFFEGVRAPAGPGFYTTGRYSLLDSIGIYELLQEASADWARRHDGSIVELHSYGIAPELDRGPRANRDRLLEEFFHAMPRYRAGRLVHEELMQQDDFSGFAAGSHAGRPRTRTAVPGLFLAGDWVRLELPVCLMERAVTSGRLAANAVMDERGVRGASYRTVPPLGLLPAKTKRG